MLGPKSRGAGDTLAKLLEKSGVSRSYAKAIGKKKCGKCKERQEKLNKLFPYKGQGRDDS